MPVKDYAKRSSHRPRVKKRSALLFPAVMLILIGTVSLVSYFVKQRSAVVLQVPQAVEVKSIKTVETIQSKTPIHVKTAVPQFDFYTLLPKMEVSVPKTDISSFHVTHQSYLLQVAAVRNLNDAKRLRDKLQAMGLMATIQTYHSAAGTQWNRVVTGPYSELKAAEDAQDILLDQHMDSLLLRIKPGAAAT